MVDQPGVNPPGGRCSGSAEELANCITHACGAVLAVAGLAALVLAAARRGTAVPLVSAIVYGLTLLAMYAASTLYHATRNAETRKALRAIDHASIFLLIAGTYTPFTLVTLRGPWGWSIFIVVWALALVGLFFEGALRRRGTRFSIGLYLLMGWVALAAIRPLFNVLPRAGFALLVGGGLAYSFGTVFYLTPRLPYHHAWWHLAVLCGSLLHFLAVLLYVIPRG